MCFICLELDDLPCISSALLLLLPWEIMLSSISYPCLSIQYHVQRMLGRLSSISMSSASLIFLHLFLLLGKPGCSPTTKFHHYTCKPFSVIMHCTWGNNIPSNNSKFISTCFIYLRTLLSYPQSPPSGAFILVVKNATAICKSHLALLLMNRSQATVWWKVTAWSSCSILASLLLLTLKIYSTVSVFHEFTYNFCYVRNHGHYHYSRCGVIQSHPEIFIKLTPVDFYATMYACQSFSQFCYLQDVFMWNLQIVIMPYYHH